MSRESRLMSRRSARKSLRFGPAVATPQSVVIAVASSKLRRSIVLIFRFLLLFEFVPCSLLRAIKACPIKGDTGDNERILVDGVGAAPVGVLYKGRGDQTRAKRNEKRGCPGHDCHSLRKVAGRRK